MDTQTVTCPACGQAIRNAVPVDGRYRCGACQKKFSASEKADSPGRQRDVEVQKEPAPASYGLLLVAAWATVLLAAGLSLWFYIANESMTAVTVSLIHTSGRIASLACGLQMVLLGLLCVAAAGALARLDRSASWLAWRAGHFPPSLAHTPSGNLPYVLPLAVTGGLWIMLSLATSMETDIPKDWVEIFGGGVFSAGAGAVLLLIGIGCGEVRRFLWRMTQLGKVLAHSNHDELGLRARVRQTATSHTASTGLMFTAVVLLAATYTCALVLAIVGVRSALPGGVRDAALLGGVGFLAVVGGAYSLFRLSRLWAEMLRQWNQAAQVLGVLPQRKIGALRSAMLKYAGWLIGGGIVAIQTYLYVRLLELGQNFALYALPGSLVLMLSAVFVWWLAALKNDTLHFAAGTALFDQSHRARAPLSVRALAVLATLCGLAELSLLAVSWALALTGGVVGGLDLQMLAMLTLPFFLLAGIVVYPLLCWPLIVLDLSRGAENLNACVEAAQARSQRPVTNRTPTRTPNAAPAGEGI